MNDTFKGVFFPMVRLLQFAKTVVKMKPYFNNAASLEDARHNPSKALHGVLKFSENFKGGLFIIE